MKTTSGAEPKGTWRRAPAALVKLFDDLVAVLPPDVERRKMFGYPCVFANGHLFAGVHQENIMLRLGEAERASFLALPGAALFEPMPGRPMREYVTALQRMLDAPDELVAWLEKSHAYARSLPPKAEGKKKHR
jgi:TfoX/Sxy family transcriptional regulator of competence genes